jgi:hypothetical protein
LEGNSFKKETFLASYCDWVLEDLFGLTHRKDAKTPGCGEKMVFSSGT